MDQISCYSCLCFIDVWMLLILLINTVGGRNPAPVGKVNIPVFARFYTSQVVQDFFHQQYHGAHVVDQKSLMSLETSRFRQTRSRAQLGRARSLVDSKTGS